jgi:hypothetical protein
MRKIRDVLRLRASGMSKRQIAASLSIGPTAAGGRAFYLDDITRRVLSGLEDQLEDPRAIERFLKTYVEERRRLARQAGFRELGLDKPETGPHDIRFVATIRVLPHPVRPAQAVVIGCAFKQLGEGGSFVARHIDRNRDNFLGSHGNPPS